MEKRLGGGAKGAAPKKGAHSSTPNQVVTLNVGGQEFKTLHSTLFRLPNSRLYEIALRHQRRVELAEGDDAKADVQEVVRSGGQRESKKGRGDKSQLEREENELFFDRDPEVFRHVLDYYRTGELHLPSALCAPFIRKELIFWGLPEDFIEPCCLGPYIKYEDERKTKQLLFRDCFEELEPMREQVRVSRGWHRLRYRMWLFLEFPTSSHGAKLWTVIMIVFIVASIANYSLQTYEDCRTISYNANETQHFAKRHLNQNQTNQNMSQWNMSRMRQFYNLTYIEERCIGWILGANTSSLLEHDNRDYCSSPLQPLIILDVVLNAIFLLEFLVKLGISPCRARFLCTLSSLTELFVNVSFWVQYVLLTISTQANSRRSPELAGLNLDIRFFHGLNEAAEDHEVRVWALNRVISCCNMAQSLRVFRIFKSSRINSGLRVLILTVKKSITELALLGFLLMNGMFLFACLIYLAEYHNREVYPNILRSLWWAIITITGVGYGDMYPKSTAGYFVGAVCAISGCMVTGMAIPIIAHNFNQYYKYMKNFLNESKYHKAKCRDEAELGGGTVVGRPLAILRGIPGLRRMIGGGRAAFKMVNQQIPLIGDGVGIKHTEENISAKTDWNFQNSISDTEKRVCCHTPSHMHGFCGGEESEPLVFARPDRPKMSTADCIDRSKLNPPLLLDAVDKQQTCSPTKIRFDVGSAGPVVITPTGGNRSLLTLQDAEIQDCLSSVEYEPRGRAYTEGLIETLKPDPTSALPHMTRSPHSGNPSRFEELAGIRPEVTRCHTHKHRPHPLSRSASENAIKTSRKDAIS